MYLHVHVVMHLYVQVLNMSVLCSDMYVPFCPILSRWVGFQMLDGKPPPLAPARRLDADVHLESPENGILWNIPGIFQVYEHPSLPVVRIPEIYLVYTCHMKHIRISQSYTRSMHIPSHIPGQCIFQSYDFQPNLYIPGIYLVIGWYLLSKSFLSSQV